MYEMASATLTKLCSLHTIGIIFCLVSTQLPVSSGSLASVLRTGDPHIKNTNYDSSHSDYSSNQQKASGKAGESGNGDGLLPTYVPFLSSRALSNIPEFFQHLRENLEALQQDEEIEREGEDGIISGGGDFGDVEEPRLDQGTRENDEGRLEPYGGDRLTSSPQLSWQPAPIMGLNGRINNIRSFVHQPTVQENYLRRAHNYNPSWLYTNLGLGRRRRGR